MFTSDDLRKMGFTRRDMLQLSAMAGVAGITQFLVGCSPKSGGDDSYPHLPDEKLPVAPEGMCMDPQSELEHALWALGETIVPGKDTDPAGDPGANESCALNVALDPTLPMADLAAVVLGMLDGVSDELYGTQFRLLDYDPRVAVGVEAERRLPVMTLLYRLIRSAFYGAGYNEIGVRWMGFPGENLGYIHHADFTFGQPVCKEFTKEGNLP